MNTTNSKTVKWNTTFRPHQKEELKRQATEAGLDINEYIVLKLNLNLKPNERKLPKKL